MIDGSILIGAEQRQRPAKFTGHNAATGAALPNSYSNADVQDVADACALAADAAPALAALSPNDRAAFLESIATHIEEIGEELIATALAETGLPRPRLEGERGRTTGQLRLFASEVRAGYWLDVTIDPALPDRTPPRADLRRVNVPLGPVAVFGASNFPLAFSVAGGDTASAFAAGCPVVVKGHPAHPGTGELVARAIADAVAASGLPAGTFSYLPGTAHELGGALVADPHIKAVGFTGSRGGGLALAAIAAKRAEPIPVYAEMSAINPVVLMPHALAARAEALGPAFVASLTLGAGQFCTNPGVVIALDGPDLDRFIAAAAEAVGKAAPQVMLTPGIRAAYDKGVAALEGNRAARLIARGTAGEEGRGVAALFETDADSFARDPALADEVFGAASVVIRCKDMDALAQAVAGLEGQLTATIHLDPSDEADAARILPLLADRAGRVLANGWPTGVEVTWAMVHGGPYPATTDGRSTSVGTAAMSRFLRPVCYQDIPAALLPLAVRDDNPWGLPRRVEGKAVTA
ncbi:aldehyde dehydrogenase (NADP(+)) [Sphingobium sufflavum]|uniref:aldehyde dehydrogenase (NADP(+)) n=1 Tax=Sphingobium sufflavum TaxID=1129547 RepID=UPI001F41E63E|nr:aldehyde dehydrogenase (NADP(+)) [Sphingobium sufflavum]MCE7796329.1 aldehyde dehydrogenase (NADP(+)) [Sphingobium sufflavum]